MTGPRESRRILVMGLAFIGALFLAQFVFDHFITRTAQARSRHLERSSIASVEQLARIRRDLDRERILIDDHIAESDPAKMPDIERALARVAADLQQAMQAYEPLNELPNEAAEWQKARVLIERFNDSVAEILAVSRKNLDREARAKIRVGRSDYATVDHVVASLIELNRSAAFESLARVQNLQNVAETINWAVRAFALAVFALLGWQLVRQVTAYEKQIKDYSDLLEMRNRDLDDFAGRVAHDLRNALAPIAMSPAVLRHAAADPKRIADIADRTERYSQRATGIIDGLLAFSRASRHVEPNEAAAVQPAVASVIEEVAPLAAQLEAKIEVGEIPELRVRCDDRLLHVVLVNLVGNAVKYLRGREEKRVRISARREGSSCRIDVQDTGPGIPKEAQARIFEPFYRIKGTRAPGTGIGLATVRRIVNARAGRIAVKSVEGQGSLFQVWLPLAAEPTDRPAPHAAR